MLSATEKFVRLVGDNDVIIKIAEAMDDPMSIIFDNNPERVYRDEFDLPLKRDPFKSEKGLKYIIVPMLISAVAEILASNDIVVEYEAIEDFILDCFIFTLGEGWNISIPPEMFA